MTFLNSEGFTSFYEGRKEKESMISCPQELISLEEKILAAHYVAKTRENRIVSSRFGLGWRVSIELLTAIVVGTWLGWLLDSLLGTRPWVMFVFLLLGGIAGVMNAYRTAHRLSMAVGFDCSTSREKERGNIER